MFFFNQKTAYEMRISDWSSDVCSADLVIGLVHRAVPAAVVGLEPIFGEAAPDVFVRRLEGDIDAPAQVAEHRQAVAFQRRDNFDLARVLVLAAVFFRQLNQRKIGRASCRERVYLYV